MKRVAIPAAIALIAAAIAVDAVRPPAPVAAPLEARRAGEGMLTCPILRHGTSSGALHLAAKDAARVRISFHRVAGGKPVDQRFSMASGSVRTLRVPKAIKGSVAAVVRYRGGPVAASHTLRLEATRTTLAGSAGGACLRTEGTTLVVPHLRTLRANTSLSVFNPGTGSRGLGAADISIALLADGKELFLQNLQRQTIPPRGRRDFRLGDFAFDVRDLTAVITMHAGRVSAEALVRSDGGASIVAAVPPARSLVAVAGRSGSGSVLTIGLIGEDDAGLDARLLSETEQGRAPGLPVSIEPVKGIRRAIPDRNAGRPVAYAVDLTIGSPVVSAAGWTRRRGRTPDEAIAEAVATARSWLAVVGGADRTVRVLVANPGDRAARITVRRTVGPVQELVLEGGRVAVLGFPGSRPATVGVEITSSEQVAVVVDAFRSAPGGRLESLSFPATAFRDPGRVAVELAPRVGVPAPTATR